MPATIKNFTQSPNGHLYISDGFSKVKLWDGVSTNFETAGLAAPTDAVLTAAASGSGRIIGKTHIYQRFLDRHNQPSNAVAGVGSTQPFSPITGSGSITNVTNTSPITVTTSAAHGLSTGNIVFITGVTGATTANGIWSITVTSSTAFQLTSAIGGTDGSILANQSDITSIQVTFAYPDATYTSGLKFTVSSPSFISLLTEQVSLVATSGTGVSVVLPSQTIALDAGGGNIRTNAIDGSTFLYAINASQLSGGGYTEGQVLGTTGTVYLANSATSTSGGTYTGGGTWIRGASQLNYTNLGSAPTQAVKRQILRTKNGDTTALWVDLDETDEDDTSLSSTNTDDDLSEKFSLTDVNGDDLLLNRFGEPPTDKPFLFHASGRMLGWGYPVWSQGKVAVTNGSATVTCQNCNLTSGMQLAGRRLYVAGAANSYEISTFNSAAAPQTITLTASYTDSTNTSAAYAILPDAGDRRRTLNWSDTEWSSAWDSTDGLSLPEDALAGEATNGFPLDRVAYLTADNRLWRVVYAEEPNKDGQLTLGPQRGCVNSRCAVAVEGNIYLMDRQGVFRLSGTSVEPASTAIHDLFDPERPGKWKINFRWSQYFHAVHDQEHETIKWFVSMTGRYPRHALCYQYRLDRWWIEEYPLAIGSSALGTLGTRRQVFLGCEGGTVQAAGHGHLDGITAGSGTTRGTVATAGFNWFTCSGAVFPTDWPGKQLSVDIVSGRGKGQRRRIVKIDSSDATKLYLDAPWLILPEAGQSVFQVAGVRWYFRSGWYNWTEVDREVPRRVDAVFQPQTADSLVDLRLYENHSETPVVWDYSRQAADNSNVAITKGQDSVELIQTETDGHFQFGVPGHRETRAGGARFVSAELRGVTNGERHRLYQMEIRGAAT